MAFETVSSPIRNPKSEIRFTCEPFQYEGKYTHTRTVLFSRFQLGISRKFIVILTKLVEEDNFDTTVPLKDGTSLQNYAESTNK